MNGFAYGTVLRGRKLSQLRALNRYGDSRGLNQAPGLQGVYFYLPTFFTKRPRLEDAVLGGRLNAHHKLA